MAKTQYLTYSIHLTDPDLVAQLQAQYPQGVNRAPYDPLDDATGAEGGAAVEFAIAAGVYATDGRLSLFGVDALPHSANFLSSPWFVAAGNYPRDAATFTRSSGGFLGIGGTTTRYYWMGQFVLAATEEPTVDGVPVAPAELNAISQRHLCEGFEVPGFAGGAAHSVHTTPDASRHVGGMGLRADGRNNASVSVPADRFDPGFTGAGRWDRIYVRWRNPGSQSIAFWRCHAFPSDSSGGALTVLPSGQMGVENINLGTRALLGTVFDLTDGEWHLVDVIYEFNSAGAGGNGRLRVYVDHGLSADFSISVGSGGMGTNSTRIARVTIGNTLALSGDDVELDLDDWIQAAIPPDLTDSGAPAWASGTAYIVNDVRRRNGNSYRCILGHTSDALNAPGEPGGVTFWTPQGWVDFFAGSKVILVKPNALTQSANWTGTFRSLQAATAGGYDKNANMTSSTASALLEASVEPTDITEELNATGPASMQVMFGGIRGANSGTLGFSVNGAVTDTAIVQTGAYASQSVMYRPSGLLQPPTITPLLLRHVKGSSADAATATFMVAQVELLGIFGKEDQRATETEEGEAPEWPVYAGAHNRPYPRSPWAIGGVSAPIAPVSVYAGTYVGDGAGIDLTFRNPVHWFFTRPVQAVSQGSRWWSTMVSARRGQDHFGKPFVACEVREDLSFVPGVGENDQQQRYILRIAGNDAESNALGVTYQYIAISDPGMRFMLNAAISHGASIPSIVNALVNAEFVPEFLQFMSEDQASATSTGKLGVKSTGHAAPATVAHIGTLTANALTFGTGQFTTQPAFHGLLAGHENVALNFWRSSDGNDDPNEAAFISIGSYTGDGSASRTLTVGTAGKRPLWAMVMGDGAAGVYRDPSHTGTISNLTSGGQLAATGITGGGVNQISVASGLNGNGIVHHYFIVWAADGTAGNGGWGTNPAGGEINPVEPDSPIDGPWPDDPTEPVPPPPTTPSTPDPGDLSTDIASTCVASSTRLVNLALQELGVSVQITSLATDTSQEAFNARLIYKTAIDQVLRDFPWPFATRYANLTRVGGTALVPVNGDWQYSYALPTNYLFARRIVDPLQKKRGPWPAIPFRLGANATDTADLLFTDQPNNDDDVTPAIGPELEYTFRVNCPAARGDAIFRQACIHRLASLLAKPLSRDEKDADRQLKLYHVMLQHASTVHMREQEHQDDQGPDADWIKGR